MPKKLSPKQLFLLLYLSTLAFGVTVGLISMLTMMRGVREAPDSVWDWFLWFLWPFGIPIILIAIFFILIAIPRARIALNRLEIPEKYSPKHFLLLLWLTAGAFIVGVVLHNGFYGLDMIAGHITPLSYLLEGLHVAFFIIAIPIAPAGIVVGAIGKVWEWTVTQPIEIMKAKGIQLPTTWPYFAPFRCYAWLWKFSKGVEAITDRRIRAAGVFASVFFLGIIGFVIIRAIIQHRLEKA
jgi:heme/copper-type cytochrome/quinol oxidase subunit 2